MIAEAYEHEYAYWNNEEYLADLENADLNAVKVMYQKWQYDVSSLTLPRTLSVSYIANGFGQRMRITRNPLVRMYNKLIKLEMEKELANEMLSKIVELDDKLAPKRKKR